ncbi:RDD family protein [Pseudoxanthomonas wuyuanensis]
MESPALPQEKPRALIGWRLLALLYDLWPVLAVWMLISAGFTLGYLLAGHGARENIPPYSPLQVALWLICWGATGLYAVLSWRRGGQTLGMRPWRLKVVAANGGAPSVRALWKRFAVATLSLLLGGLGFWWAWVDRRRLTWHDRASGTRVIRLPKKKA